MVRARDKSSSWPRRTFSLALVAFGFHALGFVQLRVAEPATHCGKPGLDQAVDPCPPQAAHEVCLEEIKCRAKDYPEADRR